ncbi:hypothetical protein LguiA_016088 [Lonicera macranthoides]
MLSCSTILFYSEASTEEMTQLLGLLVGYSFLDYPTWQSCPRYSLSLLQCNSLCKGEYAAFQKCRAIQFSLQGSPKLGHAVKHSLPYRDTFCDGAALDVLPHVKTLGGFPKEELLRKVVMVRFDSTIILRKKQDRLDSSVTSAISTIKYLYEAGAKVILVSSWRTKSNSKLLSAESVAEFLSSILQLKVVPVKFVPGCMPSVIENIEKNVILLENLSEFKEEPANCSKFAKQLSSGVDIFVNDAFSLSHKILASTVGVCSFCYANVAGLHFEEGLHQLRRTTKTNKKPYVAIIGGGNLSNKAIAVHFLASICDGLIFVGNMAFQIMHALGLPVSVKFVEHGAGEEAFRIIHLAKLRSIPILCPKDFWCTTENLKEQLEICPAHSIPEGRVPVDLGPSSLDEITSFLSKCEKITWIGPVKFGLSNHDNGGASKLALMLEKLSRRNCDITVIGTAACKALVRESNYVSLHKMVENASIMWEFLKGRKLHGLMALDRAYPFEIDWHATYTDPARPLVVDIGSGNGLFLFEMASQRKDLNFLGLEMNKKLVRRCLDSLHQSGMKNGYFITTNATSSFRSIVSSYPGELVLVSIQCPNPDFNKPENRWRMVQRSLVEAIADLLALDGKVFLQSDIEAVAARMKEEFTKYSKGKLAIMNNRDDTTVGGGGGWLKENPFGVQSDWEQHVIDRGDPMFRLILSKSSSNL